MNGTTEVETMSMTPSTTTSKVECDPSLEKKRCRSPEVSTTPGLNTIGQSPPTESDNSLPAINFEKAYATQPMVRNIPEHNVCRLIEYRGAKVSAFTVESRELICLPQAFELFLKHLVGGLHTVYTKLKRLNITPIVCNVEQVRVLRGLGAIQPGVNRCKLISCKDFDALYEDCTNSSARPGRPPKRASPDEPLNSTSACPADSRSPKRSKFEATTTAPSVGGPSADFSSLFQNTQGFDYQRYAKHFASGGLPTPNIGAQIPPYSPLSGIQPFLHLPHPAAALFPPLVSHLGAFSSRQGHPSSSFTGLSPNQVAGIVSQQTAAADHFAGSLAAASAAAAAATRPEVALDLHLQPQDLKKPIPLSTKRRNSSKRSPSLSPSAPSLSPLSNHQPISTSGQFPRSESAEKLPKNNPFDLMNSYQDRDGSENVTASSKSGNKKNADDPIISDEDQTHKSTKPLFPEENSEELKDQITIDTVYKSVQVLRKQLSRHVVNSVGMHPNIRNFAIWRSYQRKIDSLQSQLLHERKLRQKLQQIINSKFD